MQCETEQPVNLVEYEQCLKYTIEFKMGASWNKVGQHLLYGKNFLQTEIAETPAVDFHVRIMTGKHFILTYLKNIYEFLK